MLSFGRSVMVSAVALGVALLGSVDARAASTSEQSRSEQTEESDADPAPTRVRGARFQAGAFMLAHVRRESSDEKEPGTLAPGAELGLAWRVEAWEVGLTLRAANYDSPGWLKTRRTMMGSAGGRARWFAFPSSGVSPFIDAGLDFFVLNVDDAYGIGPSAHGGAGVEVFHDHAHHRLRFELGFDVPTFALSGPTVSMSFSCSDCAMSSSDRRIYLVPATLAATWTF